MPRASPITGIIGPPQDLCDSLSGRGGTWSKDGVIVFTPSSNQQLSSVSAAGGTPEPASKLDVSKAENSHRWPSFLPDGKHFLYWSRTSRGAESPVLYIGELGSLQAKELMKSETMAVYASGYLPFVRGQTLMAQPFNPRRVELSGETESMAEHVAINGATVRAMFSPSETGTLVYQTGEASSGWNLVWWDRDGKQTGSIAQPDRYIGPALSPDGTRLAVTIFAGSQGTADIWIFDLIRGTSTRITFSTASPANQTTPVWSPDGKTVFYASSNGGTAAKWRKDGKELFFLDPADNLVAVNVNTSSNAVRLGAPHALFQAVGIQHDFGPYDVTADGKKFLINSGNLKEGTEPVTLAQNWPAELKK